MGTKIKQILLHHRVNRKLAALERYNNAPAIASVRARTIIRNLVRGLPISSSGLLKHKTDRRLKNSLKFDLGSGFRLICVSKKEAIHVMFFGDHDSCDRWLTQHGRKQPYKKGKSVVLPREEGPVSPPPVFYDDNEFLENESGIYEISQDDLRRVFKGLTG